MDEAKRNLKGSPLRDEFKRAHKEMGAKYWACDLDFVLTEKNPPGIVAYLDCKAPGERVSFAEVLVYNALLSIAPFYIVATRRPASGPFRVYEYLGGDWRPDPCKVRLKFQLDIADWEGFRRWEDDLRAKYKRKAIRAVG